MHKDDLERALAVGVMRVYDITRPLSEETQVYPGDPPTVIRRVLDVSRGDAFTLSSIRMSSHAGTHVDAPSHFVPGGLDVDELPLDALIGEALLVELAEAGTNGVEELERAGITDGTGRVLIKTAKGQASQAYLTEEAAWWLVERGVRLVGIDQLSVDAPGSASLPIHRTLLHAGVIILEGLDLAAVGPGRYTLVCLPVKVAGCDGAPARAVLLEGVLAVTRGESWTDRAKKLVAYHREALEFVSRASGHLETSPDHARAIARLWVEADVLDQLVCSLLDEMKEELLDGQAEMDTRRGASARPVGLDEERVFYECSWSLLWGDGLGVAINLSLDPCASTFEALVLALKSGVLRRVRFPVEAGELKATLTDAYVAEATL